MLSTVHRWCFDRFLLKMWSTLLIIIKPFNEKKYIRFDCYSVRSNFSICQINLKSRSWKLLYNVIYTPWADNRQFHNNLLPFCGNDDDDADHHVSKYRLRQNQPLHEQTQHHVISLRSDWSLRLDTSWTHHIKTCLKVPFSTWAQTHPGHLSRGVSSGSERQHRQSRRDAERRVEDISWRVSLADSPEQIEGKPCLRCWQMLHFHTLTTNTEHLISFIRAFVSLNKDILDIKYTRRQASFQIWHTIFQLSQDTLPHCQRRFVRCGYWTNCHHKRSWLAQLSPNYRHDAFLCVFVCTGCKKRLKSGFRCLHLPLTKTKGVDVRVFTVYMKFLSISACSSV